ncbi:uncharacterized protein LOC132261763 [Phlebotomus argentipes]|uniref:uncharacterized protein LOC132261763 n=1 Tax=Phlebotomus argentipes TaxID=94469 RepID=UPI002893043F|nr:uncharacterized protein LOC132261763 [Phlebotomus argentipes]
MERDKVAASRVTKSNPSGYLIAEDGDFLLFLQASGSSGKLAKGKADNGDVAQLDRHKTALEIPSESFASSLSTIRSVSKAAGDFIMNSAKRFSVFVDLFRPLVGKALVVKGVPLPPPNGTLVLTGST